MNEAGPSNQDHNRNDAEQAAQATEAEQSPAQAESSALSAPSPPAFPVTVHPLVWAIQVWVVATITSLLLSGGLSSALRGAYVGAESVILLVDHASALTSQVAAICTTLLLIYAGLMSARASQSLILGAGSALLGVVPTLLVFYAHRFSLPHFYTWSSALCAGGSLLLGATQARSNTPVRTILALAGLTLLSAVLRTDQLGDGPSPILSRLGSGLQPACAWLTIFSVAALHLCAPRFKPLRGALILGLAVLLGATASASMEPSAPRWVLLTGRALLELTSNSSMGVAGPFALSLGLLVLFSTFLSQPTSFSQVVCSLLAVCTVAPLSPLTIAAMTLSGYFAVVICWVPSEVELLTSR